MIKKVKYYLVARIWQARKYVEQDRWETDSKYTLKPNIKADWEEIKEEYGAYKPILAKENSIDNPLNKPKMTTTKKPTVKKKTTVRGLKTVCNRVSPAYGKKVDGTLRKGFHYVGGKVVKVTATKTKTKRKPVAKKKKLSGLLGLGILGIL
jgi:hypothetical protein